jgi:hypothetical protein
MNCPDDWAKLEVRHTRPGYLGQRVYRVYECPDCGKRWKTTEIFTRGVDLKRCIMYIAPISYGSGLRGAGPGKPGAIILNSAGNRIPTPRVIPKGTIFIIERPKTRRKKGKALTGLNGSPKKRRKG